MNKKEYVLAMLKELSEFWPMAKPLQTLVESNALTDAIIDTIADILRESVKVADTNMQQNKLEQSIKVLDKIREMEDISHQKDEEDIANLESMIDQI